VQGPCLVDHSEALLMLRKEPFHPGRGKHVPVALSLPLAHPYPTGQLFFVGPAHGKSTDPSSLEELAGTHWGGIDGSVPITHLYPSSQAVALPPDSPQGVGSNVRDDPGSAVSPLDGLSTLPSAETHLPEAFGSLPMRQLRPALHSWVESHTPPAPLSAVVPGSVVADLLLTHLPTEFASFPEPQVRPALH
jgi:hypothetical protein